MDGKILFFNRGLVLALLLLATSMLAFAQYGDRLGGNWNNPASALITNIIMDRLARRRLGKRLGVKHSGAGARSGTATSGRAETAIRIDDGAIRFRPTGTQLKTREIAKSLGATGADNEQIFTLLTTILQEYEKGARKAGRPNDLALALSFFFATNATVYHDMGAPPDPQVMGLRETIAGALVEGNALSGVTDRQKQEMYESLVLYTGLALAGYQEAKQGGDAESLKTYRQLAGLNLQAVTGLSPDKITFTDQGLRIEREPEPDDNSVAAPTGSAGAGDAPAASSNTGAVSWARMIKEYEENEIAADAKYNGKRVRVVGPFSKAEVSGGQIIVWFVTPFATYSHFACYFPNSRRTSVARLQSGQEIVVEGISRGLKKEIGRVALEDCVLR